MGVGEWLRNFGLGQYEPAFIESAIDFDVLPQLSEDDLEKLGMRLGDRKRFINAINARTLDSPASEARELVERSLCYAGCRTPSLDRNDLRSGGLDCYRDPT